MDPSPTPSPSEPSTSDAPPQTSAGTNGSDPEKPFKCDQCDVGYKTQGALTNHKNKQHRAAEPQPSAIPVAANADGDIKARVKQKIASAPFAGDLNKLLAIFDSEAGTRNFEEMTDEQVLKIEARLDQEVAAAAS